MVNDWSMYLPTAAFRVERIHEVLDDLAERWERQPPATLRLVAGDLTVECTPDDVDGEHVGSDGASDSPSRRSMSVAEFHPSPQAAVLGHLRVGAGPTLPGELPGVPPHLAKYDVGLCRHGKARLRRHECKVKWHHDGGNTSVPASVAFEFGISGLRSDDLGGVDMPYARRANAAKMRQTVCSEGSAAFSNARAWRARGLGVGWSRSSVVRVDLPALCSQCFHKNPGRTVVKRPNEPPEWGGMTSPGTQCCRWTIRRNTNRHRLDCRVAYLT